MVRGRKRGGFQQRGGRAKAPGKHFKQERRPKGFKGRERRKQPTSEDLDKDIEQYWGEKVVAEHLDKDMDEYWAKEQPKPS